MATASLTEAISQLSRAERLGLVVAVGEGLETLRSRGKQEHAEVWLHMAWLLTPEDVKESLSVA